MNPARKHRLRTAVWRVAAPLVVTAMFVAPGVLRGALSATPALAGPTSMSPSYKPARPYWIELTVPQREALNPLADDWERLDLQTKKKWVEIAGRYPKMTPDEQARTQQRMREWAMLTPEQRRVARDSFARVRSMNPEQRADMLRKYRELPPERRQALTTEGKASKAIIVPKPLTVPVPRRTQISEGAKARNPALAAQKGANPVVGPPVSRRQPAPVPSMDAGPATLPPAGATTVRPASVP